MEIYAIVVVYNKNFETCTSYKCLSEISNINIVLVDNSTADFNNDKFQGGKYISMNGNKGLSKAYNKAIDEIGGTQGYICLFDDDTFVDKDYFEKLESSILKTKADVLLPIIKDEIGIMSPCNLKGIDIRRIHSIGDLDSDFVGINSGMCINLDVFKDYRYDENIFLDYIDFTFLKDMKKSHKKIIFFDACLKQKFSINSDSRESAKIRFGIFKKDFRLYCKGHMFYYYYKMLKKRLKLSVKYLDLSFFIL